MKIDVCGLPVDSTTIAEVVDRVIARCDAGADAGPALTIYSLNVDMIVKASRDADFAGTMSRASILIPDGMPVVWLGRGLGGEFPERVTGADLLPAISTACARDGYSIFLLGAAPGIADEAAERLVAHAPGLRVAGTFAPEHGFEKDPRKLEDTLSRVRAAKPDVIFVALGAPRQERFVEKYAAELGAPVILPVGAAIDMAAGRVHRAPRFVQKGGGEWLWRLAQEPRRLARRYLVEDPAFLRLAFLALARRNRSA